MYAKIYKEIFLNGYSLKKQLDDSNWIINIDNQNYYLFVYLDNEIILDKEGIAYKNYNEAELKRFKKIRNTEKRIKRNKIFLEKIKEIRKKQPYLFRNCANAQGSLFSYDNYIKNY